MNSSANKNENVGYFVRKIVKPEIWLNNLSKQYHEVLIEPARYEFKAKNSTLSWWHIPDITTETLNRIAASIISVYEKPEAIPLELLVIPASSFLKNMNMNMVQSSSDAHTAINSMKDSHFNMENISIQQMDYIYKITNEAIQTCKIKRVNFNDALRTLKSINLDSHEQMGKMGEWIKSQVRKDD